QLNEAPLLMADFGFSDENFFTGEKGRARQGIRERNQAYPYRRLLRRIGPTQLSLGLPACTPDARGSQENQGCNPIPHPEANQGYAPVWLLSAHELGGQPKSVQRSTLSGIHLKDYRNSRVVAPQPGNLSSKNGRDGQI